VRELTLGSGILYFPVTPFDREDRVDAELLGELITERLPFDPGAVFAACGTGEFHALSASEHAQAVRVSVEATAGAVPVVAGAGGPLGHAREAAVAAERAGADGLLVMPPYLVSGPQGGLVEYVRDLSRRTELPLIVYHRGSAQFSGDAMRRLLEIPSVVGVKDGAGDVAVMQSFVRIAAASGRDIRFFNGLLTAEASQAAYGAIGVPLYSSAAFAMAPEVATAFHRAFHAGDAAEQARLLDGFFFPLVALRDETPGFAVSLVKAGLRLTGKPVGPVRAPLVDPDDDQTARLTALLERGRELAA
jgi:5-dehydro-4-deoxyglucarate dehydratase